MDLFTSREIVSITYLSLFFIWILIDKKLRKHFLKLISIACNIRLIVPFIFFLLYSLILVYYSSLLPFWNFKYFKDIFIWIIFAGIPLFFNSVSIKNEEKYFKKMLIKNLGLLALVEFFTGTFTFDIFVEFLIQPLLLIFILLQIVSGMKDEYKPVEKLVNWIVAITGFIILGFTIKVAIATYQDLNSIDLIISLILPPFLSMLFLPITYFFALYSKYSHIFALLKIRESNINQNKKNYKLMLIKKGKFSYDKVRRLVNILNNRKTLNLDDKEFSQLFDKFK